MPRRGSALRSVAVELIFIRHGEPAWSVEGVSQPNPHLTERGRRQAELAAERLAGGFLFPTEILVSPTTRAQETAAPLAAATGMEATTIGDLEEIRMPDWTGELEERVQRLFQDARGRPPSDWWDGMPGGESFHAFHDRISRVMLKILDERLAKPRDAGHPQIWDSTGADQRIAIVAHGGTNSVALSYLLGIEPTPWEWERFILGHASIARLKLVPLAGGHVFSLRAFNDRDHLPPQLRTR